MAKAGVVEIEVQPGLSGFGAQIDQFVRTLRPIGVRAELAGDIGADLDRQRAQGQRSLDQINTRQAQGELRQLGATGERELGRIRSAASSLSSGTLVALGAGTTVLGAKMVGSLRPATEAASDLNEAVAYSEQVFGASAATIDEWSDGAARALGQSKRQATEAATTFASFGKAAGLAGDDLVAFSTDLVKLATDLASARNTSPEEAITAIGAALRGETEPIRAYGVLLDDATTRQEALALGITKTTKDALTPQQKVLAVQSLLFKQTADAQDDFARTSDGLANAQRIQAAETENAKAALGEGLSPVVASATKTLTAFLNVLDKIPGATSALGVGIAGVGTLAILGGAATSILGGVKAIQELRAGTVAAGEAGVAANEAIAASSTRAAAATATVAASYDAVTVAATRAGAASSAVGAASTLGVLGAGPRVWPSGPAGAAPIGTDIVMSRQWQYATPRFAGAIGPGAPVGGLARTGSFIDVSSREVLALGPGVTAATSAATASTGVFSRWGDTLRAAGAKTTDLLGRVSPLTAGMIGLTAGTIGLSYGLQKANEQTDAGIEKLTRIGNITSLKAAFDPGDPKRLQETADRIAAIIGETERIEPQNWMDRIGDAVGLYETSIFGDSQESGNRARAAADLIDELTVSFAALGEVSSRRILDAAAQSMRDAGLSADEVNEKLDPLYELLDDTAAAERASGSISDLGDEIERLGVKIDPTASKWQNFSTVLGGIFDPIQNAINAQEALSDGQKTLADAQKKYEDIVNGNTEAVKSAAEGLQEARKALDEAVAKTGPGSRAARDAAQEVRDALRAYRELQVEAGKTREGDFFEDYTEDFRAAEDRIREASENLRAIETGNTEEVRNARERLTDAQNEYNEALADTGPNSEAARDALEEVEDQQRNVIDLQLQQEQAAAALKEQLEEHPEAIQASIDKVDEWVDQGLISVGVAEQWKKELWAAANEAQRLRDNLPSADQPPRENFFVPSGVNLPEVAERIRRSGSTSIGLGPSGFPNFGGTRYRAYGGPVDPWSTYEVLEGGAPEVLHTAGRSYLMTGGADGRVEPLPKELAAPVAGGALEAEMRGLRGDLTGVFAFLMRQATIGGGAETMIPVLRELIVEVRKLGEQGRSPAAVRAGALEFA